LKFELFIAALVITGCDKSGDPKSAAPAVTASVSAAAAAAPSLPPASSNPPPAPSNAALRSACEGSCQAGASLHCSEQAQCVERCLSSMHMPGCDDELLRFMACAAREPAAHWECSDGIAALKDGSCEREQATVAACASRHPI
jgi:hypothetical protein